MPANTTKIKELEKEITELKKIIEDYQQEKYIQRDAGVHRESHEYNWPTIAGELIVELYDDGLDRGVQISLVPRNMTDRITGLINITTCIDMRGENDAPDDIQMYVYDYPCGEFSHFIVMHRKDIIENKEILDTYPMSLS